jgi:hypothetical protein
MKASSVYESDGWNLERKRLVRRTVPDNIGRDALLEVDGSKTFCLVRWVQRGPGETRSLVGSTWQQKRWPSATGYLIKLSELLSMGTRFTSKTIQSGVKKKAERYVLPPIIERLMEILESI